MGVTGFTIGVIGLTGATPAALTGETIDLDDLLSYGVVTGLDLEESLLATDSCLMLAIAWLSYFFSDSLETGLDGVAAFFSSTLLYDACFEVGFMGPFEEGCF